MNLPLSLLDLGLAHLLRVLETLDLLVEVFPLLFKSRNLGLLLCNSIID
jgi:hypothetical protein